MKIKINKVSDATKILIIAGTIIIVCVIVALGFKMINEGRASTNNSVNQFNNMTSEYSDISLSNYDGASVLGSEVINLIKKAKDRNYDFSITVITKANKVEEDGITSLDASTKLIYNTISPTPSPLEKDTSDDNYINPNAQFYGEISKNDNGIISNVTFIQEN